MLTRCKKRATQTLSIIILAKFLNNNTIIVDNDSLRNGAKCTDGYEMVD